MSNRNYIKVINISSNSNYNLSDSIKVTENPISNSKIRKKTSENTTYNSSRWDENGDYINENVSERNEYSYDTDMRLGPTQLDLSIDYYNDDEDDKIYSEEYDSGKEYEPVLLPEAKELVQLPINSRKITDNYEEDMGYDEDDERVPIGHEGHKKLRSRLNNEGGSGGLETKRESYSYRNDKLGFGYFNSFRKEQKFLTDPSSSQVGLGATEVDLRESSGNFANDDEDNDDESDDDDGFFNSKRRSNGRYFKKNTNDAIKIISTPLGKVGIVYQQTATSVDDKSNTSITKKSTSFTDFDALSPDPESSHRLASSHPKITPVLTPDGKVALLYRGDSENTKYEPIRNLTAHKLKKGNDAYTDKKIINLTNVDSSDSFEYSDAESAGDLEEDSDLVTSAKSNIKSNIDIKVTTEEQAAILSAPDFVPTTGSFIIRPTDSILPMINRPLSEVLGIKKNQFKQFRIKDVSTTTEGASISAVNMYNSEANTLHYRTKVNLADYPTSSRTRSYDFDFSRDNTMLDERSRSKEYQTKSVVNTKQPIVSTNEAMNEDILSKTEVVNLAVVPHFDEDLERLQRLREHEDRHHYRQRHLQKEREDDLSGIHCIMQVMMGIAAISTVFGMLGTFFKQRILDQLRLMHW